MNFTAKIKYHLAIAKYYYLVRDHVIRTNKESFVRMKDKKKWPKTFTVIKSPMFI